jgi:hypothetical protein
MNWPSVEEEWNPNRVTEAYQIFKEHLERESSETWRVLEDPEIGKAFTDALEFFFLSQHRDVFERITMAPSREILKKAARAARYDVKLSCGKRDDVLIDWRSP